MIGRVYFTAERLHRALHRRDHSRLPVRGRHLSPQDRTAALPRQHRSRTASTHDEFVPVQPQADARDLLFLGAFRDLKGIDVLLNAIAKLQTKDGLRVSANLVGQPEGRATYEAMAGDLGIADRARVSRSNARPRRFCDRARRHGAVTRRIDALCGAGSYCRRHAGRNDQRRRHPGDFRLGSAAWFPPATPMPSPPRSSHVVTSPDAAAWPLKSRRDRIAHALQCPHDGTGHHRDLRRSILATSTPDAAARPNGSKLNIRLPDRDDFLRTFRAKLSRPASGQCPREYVWDICMSWRRQ